MGATDIDRENPYAEPRAAIEDPTKPPAPKTGFTTLQGLAIIAVCALILFSMYHYRQSAWRDDMTARIGRIALPPPKR